MADKIYVSRKDDTVKAKVVQENEKFKTVILEFITGDKAGKATSISTSTLRRWWKAVTVEEGETDANLELLAGGDSAEQANTVIKEHKLVPMPGIEKLEELKKEYTPKKKDTSKVDRTKDIENLKNFLYSNFNVKYYDSVNAYMISVNNKTVAEIRPQRKYICIYVKQVENIPDGVEYKDGYKYFLPVRINLNYESDFEHIINSIL